MHLPTFGRVLLGGLAITLAGTVVARADEPVTLAPSPDAPASADRSVDSASARVREISAQLDSQRQQAREIRERLTRGDSALPEINARIDAAAGRVDARRREMAVADTRYAPLKFADDKVRLDAIGDFEKSPAYRAALQAVTDAAAALRYTQDESLRRLTQTQEYQESAAGNDAASAGRLDALQRQRLASDPNIAIAQARLSAAKGAVDALRKRFMEQDLPRIANVADADQALAAEQKEYDAKSAAARAAEQDLAAARSLLERQNAGLAADRTALDQLMQQIMQSQNALASATAEESRATEESNRAAFAADPANQARQAAAQPPQVIYPPTTYEYAPPAALYRPPLIYAPPPVYYGYPAYGSVIVTPYRGYSGYGYGRGYVGGHIELHYGHAHGGGHR